MFQFYRQHPLILIVAFASALLLLNINHPHVPFTDELLFEEASFEAAQGHWLIPRLNDSSWLEKPPLYFWLTAPLFHLANNFLPTNSLDLAVSTDQGVYLYPWIRRFWSLVASITAIVTVSFISRRLFPQTPSYLAPLILIAIPTFIFTSQSASLDVPLAALLSLSFLALLTYRSSAVLSTLLFVCSTASAIMVRSVFGLTPFVFLLYQLATRQLTLKPALIMALLTLSLVLPWHLYAYLQHPQEFLDIYLGFNLIEHGLEIPHGYTANPFWYYVALLSIPPWLVIATLLGLYFLFTHKILLKNLSHPQILLLIFFFLPFISLSASATRHPWYAVQLTPPLALITAALIWRFYTQVRHTVTRQVIQIFTAACVLAPTIMILGSDSSSAPNVRALEFALPLAQGQPLYAYQQPYLPHTKLYRPHTVHIINDDFLATNINTLIIYINEQDLPSLSHTSHHLELLKSFPPGGIYRLTPNQDSP